MRILLLVYLLLLGMTPLPLWADELAVLMERAESGEAASQWALGMRYLEGRGLQRDYQKAEEWLRRAAEQGSVRAQYRLGRMHDKGEGISTDPAGAAAWYRKAAEQGSIAAQNNLGNLYRDGRGVPQDHAEAVSWYRKAAEAGDAAAQANLSTMYANGHGVEQDSEQAAHWLRQSARQGHGKARLSLQTMPGATLSARATPTEQTAVEKKIQKKQRTAARLARRPAPVVQKAADSSKVTVSRAKKSSRATAPVASAALPEQIAPATDAFTSSFQGEVVAASVPSALVEAPTAGWSPAVGEQPAPSQEITQPPVSPLGGFGALPQTGAEASYVTPPLPDPPAVATTLPEVAKSLPEQPPVLRFRMVEAPQEPGVVRGGAVEQDLAYPAHQPATVPTARYVDNGDGTITDRLRGLAGLKNANCLGRQMWEAATQAVYNLADGQCQLRDQSHAGEWRLLSRDEMHILGVKQK
jgi:TPR repeat protein